MNLEIIDNITLYENNRMSIVLIKKCRKLVLDKIY